MRGIQKGVNYVLIDGRYLSILREAITALETRIKLNDNEKMKKTALKNCDDCRKMLTDAPRMII